MSALKQHSRILTTVCVFYKHIGMVISIKYKFKSNWNVWFWLIWHGARENSQKIAILLRNCIHLVNGCFDDKLLFKVTFNLLQDTLQLKLNSIEQTWCLEVAYILLPTSIRTSILAIMPLPFVTFPGLRPLPSSIQLSSISSSKWL